MAAIYETWIKRKHVVAMHNAVKRWIYATVGLLVVATMSAAGRAQGFSALAALDMRVLQVADRLQSANADLCDRHSPSLGVALQSQDQFPDGRDPGFSAPVAFASVLPDGAAARAGIGTNDGLVAINDSPITKQPSLTSMPLRDSAYAMLGEVNAGDPLVLKVRSQGREREVSIETGSECRALVEVIAGDGSTARSDGRVVQLGEGLVSRVGDQVLAVILAHELAHAVLHHRDRLSAEGVSKGLGGEFGRSRELNAIAEIEADRLSVHLLANAGFDPSIASAFWRSAEGRRIGGGLFRSSIYSSPEGRATTLDREIAEYLGGGAPTWPGHLLIRRDR